MNRKVIIIGPAFPYRGGIANFNDSLAKGFEDKGADVRIYSFSLQYPSFLFPGKTQYEERVAPKKTDALQVINSINPLNWIKVSKMIKKENPDYIIIRYWIPFMSPCLGTIAKLVRKTTKVCAITDNVIPHEKRLGDKQLTQYFVNNCDAFVTLSSSVLDDLFAFTKTNRKIFIPHPIYNFFGEIQEKEAAKEKLSLNKDDRYLLFFGFIRKYKGLDIMLDVMSDSRIRDMDIKLIVAGEFYDDKELYINQIKKLGIEENIILKTHFIPEEDVKFYFCASDIITQTYRAATQSGVTQIAYHFERPMLVTNVGALAEIVPHNKVGYVCSINPKEIADSIVDFYTNKREQEFHQNLKEEKKRFTWALLVEGIDHLMCKTDR